MKKRERVILRLDGEEPSVEGKLLSYLKDDPALSPRAAVMRALKAFYLPWVLEEKQSEEELRAIAKTTIEELQYRAFQIEQRFLPNKDASTSADLLSIDQATSPQPIVDLSTAKTVAEMQQEISSSDLSQFLDDF